MLKALLVLAFVHLHIHVHHPFHGPGVDYWAVAVASFLSWAGLPGPGEPVLIAAGIIAAHGKLDIATVVVIAWLSATAGGIAGWGAGRALGRTVMSAPGPLYKLRIKTLRRGDEVFARYAVVAIILTPSWIAGMVRVRTSVYQLTNAITAAIWAAGIGLGAYFAGPPVIDAVEDLGTVTGVALGVLILLLVLAEIRRRHRRQTRRRAAGAEAEVRAAEAEAGMGAAEAEAGMRAAGTDPQLPSS